jgi:hypothetical protein
VGERTTALHTALLSSVRLRERRLPEWGSVLLKTAFSTFMLAGILETWLDALLFAVVMGLMLLGREYLSSHLDTWTKLINHVPLLLRLVVGIGLNFLLARQIITAMWYSSGTFRPIIISVALSLLIFFLLIPDLKTQVYRNRAETRQVRKAEKLA